MRFPRLDILPPAQRVLWPQLSAVRQCDFALYGGTAIALRLGHRQSVDFDFFTARDFQPDWLISRFPFLAHATIVRQEPNTLTVLARGGSPEDSVKVSFFGGLGFGRLGDPSLTPDGVLEVASIHDLLAHKLKVILQRVEAKDYLDIDAILRDGHDLALGLAGAQALYGNFPAQEALKALAYFKGGDLHLLPNEVCQRLARAASAVRNIPAARVASTRLTANEADMNGQPSRSDLQLGPKI